MYSTNFIHEEMTELIMKMNKNAEVIVSDAYLQPWKWDYEKYYIEIKKRQTMENINIGMTKKEAMKNLKKFIGGIEMDSDDTKFERWKNRCIKEMGKKWFKKWCLKTNEDAQNKTDNKEINAYCEIVRTR